jgi:hypothetical protein
MKYISEYLRSRLQQQESVRLISSIFKDNLISYDTSPQIIDIEDAKDFIDQFKNRE